MGIHSPLPHGRRGAAWDFISPGAWIILALALVSGTMILARPARYADHDLEFWAFADTHVAMYRPLFEQDWNPAHQPIPGVPNSGSRVKLLQLSITAEQQRMMSAFYAGTPVADLMEVERSKVGGIFSLPLAKIGLYDLTQRLKDEHIYDQINQPSFSPWTTRGHVFGIPHDVHPVMLAYRADIVEAAGIDVTQIETWDDYVRVMSPLMKEVDAEGKPKHYLLNVWPTLGDQMEVLLLQNGGAYFDADGVPNINSPQNAHTIAQIALWCTGPTRIAVELPEFNGGANKLRVEGYVIGSFMPDWLSGTWRHDMPQLAGKIKLMPLPAFEKGGRRTSIWGGTMLGISKTTRDFDKAWALAKELYTSPKIAQQLYREAGIVSPVKKMWTSPIYDEPVPYFCNQPQGRLYLNLASQVPLRTSSPFHSEARSMLQNATLDLKTYAEEHHIATLADLQPKAQALLDDINRQLQKMIDEDLFIDPRLEMAGTNAGPPAAPESSPSAGGKP